MDLKIKAVSNKIGKEIPLPYYATPGSAAMDLHACIDEAVTIPAGGRRTIPTGIAIALPSADYVALSMAWPPPTAWGSSTAITEAKYWWGFKTPGNRISLFSRGTGSPS